MECSHEKLIGLAIESFYTLSRRERMDIRIMSVDNLFENGKEFIYDSQQQIDFIKSKDFIDNLNATIITGKNMNDTFYILIKKELLNTNYFVGTIIHELVHIYDLIDFFEKNNCKNFHQTSKMPYSDTFFYWTEFHARRLGYFFLRATLRAAFDYQDTDEEQILYIRNKELDFHHNLLLDSRYKYIINHNKGDYLYHIVHYLGRISVWIELFPNDFSKSELIPNFLINQFGQRIIDLYESLSLMLDFSAAFYKFDKLNAQLNNLF